MRKVGLLTPVSWVEIKPDSKGRNDPASGARIRSHEKRGIFLSNKPDINDLVRACLEEKCRLTQILVAGSFRPLLAGLISTHDSSYLERRMLSCE